MVLGKGKVRKLNIGRARKLNQIGLANQPTNLLFRKKKRKQPFGEKGGGTQIH
jgi:hypothetical protein